MNDPKTTHAVQDFGHPSGAHIEAYSKSTLLPQGFMPRQLSLATTALILACDILLFMTTPTVTAALLATALWFFLLWRERSGSAGTQTLPAIIVSGFIMTTGLGGYLIWGRISDAGGVGAHIDLTQQMRDSSFAICALTALSVLIGATIATTARPIDRLVATQFGISVGSRLYARLLLWAAMGAVVVATLAMGFDGIMFRTSYLEYTGGSVLLRRLSGATILVGIAACAALTTSKQTLSKTLGWLCLGASTALVVSQGSRRLALVPLLYLLGKAVAGRLPTKSAILTSSLASLYLISLAIAFRQAPSHGLSPHLKVLPRSLTTQLPWQPILANLLNGFSLAPQVAFVEPRIPQSALWVSIDPRSGHSAGWYAISGSLRININTPYSSLGELGNHGASVLFIYSLLLGATLTICCRAMIGAASGQSGSSPFRRIFLVSISGYIGLSFVQYNLRSTTRIAYLLVAFCGIYRVALSSRRVQKG